MYMSKAIPAQLYGGPKKIFYNRDVRTGGAFEITNKRMGLLKRMKKEFLKIN